MNRNKGQHRHDLKVIARQAMIKHGLLPDFSAEIIGELSSIEKTVSKTDSGVRDLRGLLWASIDNDDSRDLDQIRLQSRCQMGK